MPRPVNVLVKSAAASGVKTGDENPGLAIALTERSRPFDGTTGAEPVIKWDRSEIEKLNATFNGKS